MKLKPAAKVCFFLVLYGCLPQWPDLYGQARLSQLMTRPEATSYEETSRYEDVISFVSTVSETTPQIKLTHFGYSLEGRALPLVVAGSDGAFPETVKATGKLRIFVQANIHAGEVCGKEALLMLIRELAMGQHADWLQNMVLLLAPIYNADGNERIRLDNRPRQNGPLGGMGRRANAQNLDLNRDHMKLESPEARALVRLMNEFDPHVVIDLHTTNGTAHGYHLTYSPPLHPNTATPIVDLLRKRWLPEVTQAVKSKSGWDFFYYGNVPRQEGARERGWYTFDHRPRFNNNYVGLRNRIGILSEAYAYASFKERIEATKRFVEKVFEFAHRNTAAIINAIAQAEAESIVGTELAVQAGFTSLPQEIEVLMGQVERGRNPYNGETILIRKDVQQRERMKDFGTFEAVQTEVVPAAYLVPEELTGVVDLLRAHGLQMRQLERDTELDCQRFRITGTMVASREFQGHRERSLQGRYETARSTVAAGTWLIEVNQSLGRLVFYLLEPLSDDGAVNWNFLDSVLESAESYPILRLHQPLN